ncbi:sel1 repeat family protein [Pseudomonas cavernicola]|uniref:Sel1 repeat family protein n=1 Tax=Pseudomonas cavernicola TaxID=2320866 RepID=A0A418XC52_9PSED|nr:sel1 repeat family protein [Pseudomonas cavernicola]RJG10027.1 sel1 repeat family protein [Pseudomonas cavernicola]
MPRVTLPRPTAPVSVRPRLPLRPAFQVVGQLGHVASVKCFAVRLLKLPARQSVVVAQSRLGQLLCRDCGNTRGRRIGLELLHQAARAGGRRVQLELGRLYSQPRQHEPQQARHWLEQAAAEAKRLLNNLHPHS